MAQCDPLLLFGLVFEPALVIGLFYIISLKVNTYLELGVPLCLGKFDLSIYSGSQVIMKISKNKFMTLNIIKIKNKSILVFLMMIVSMIER